MTRKIPRSSIPAGFDLDKAIADYVAELQAWGEHNARCVAEAKRREQTTPTPAEPPENQPFPAPIASPLVWAALDVTWNEDGAVTVVKDYTIDEDGPTPAEQLAAKRQALHASIMAMEAAAGETVVPMAKRRYIEFQAIDAEAVPEADRTKAQRAAIEARDNMKLGLDIVARHGAKLQADASDLADNEIDGWKPEEFPHV